jgi:hypothetical protein
MQKSILKKAYFPSSSDNCCYLKIFFGTIFTKGAREYVLGPENKGFSMKKIFLSALIFNAISAMEESYLSLDPERKSENPMNLSQEPMATQDSHLTSEQQQEMGQALQNIFMSQVNVTNLYSNIILALQKAIETPEVKKSGQKTIEQIKEFSSVLMKSLKLNEKEAIRLGALFQDLQNYLNLWLKFAKTNDEQVAEQVEQLNGRLLINHLLPFFTASGTLVQPSSKALYEEYLIHVLADILQNALNALPPSARQALMHHELAEPSIPENLDEGDEDDQGGEEEFF